jgi:hypothetical protein
MKLARAVKLEERGRKKQRVNVPDHCIHCNEESYVFIQIECQLCENDGIYYDKDEYQNNPVAYNIARHKCARTSIRHSSYGRGSTTASHTSPVLKMAFMCTLFPPFDKKIMGYKKT